MSHFGTLVQRVYEQARWRGRNWYRHRVLGRCAASSEVWGRLLRYPLPWRAPVRQRAIAVSRQAALGDVIMCTAALRALKEANPACHVTFYTNYPEILQGLPFIDEVKRFADRPADAIPLEYEHCLPPHRHLARIFGDGLGVRVEDVRPSIVVRDELVEQYREAWKGLPRPIICVSRRAGPWTPNKDWPDAYWNTLLASLLKQATVVEIGVDAVAYVPKQGESYLNLIGQTTLEQMIAVIAAADLYVGPVSGPVHIAAAVRTPAVVVYGGYEDPICSAYEGNINLATHPSCSPCWLRTPCPYDKKCLSEIAPQVVEAAVWKLWSTLQPSVSL